MVGVALFFLVCAVAMNQVRAYGLDALVPLGAKLAYASVVVVPLLLIFFSDAFGPGPRERWQRYLDRGELPNADAADVDRQTSKRKTQ